MLILINLVNPVNNYVNHSARSVLARLPCYSY
jgi:hypothetical protein